MRFIQRLSATAWLQFLLLGAIFSTLMTYGQNVNGTIVGTVTDATGAVVPDATVTVLDVDTTVRHVVTTDSSGYYSLPDLQPGHYTVSAGKQGFATAVHSGLVLFVDTTLRVNATLNPGEVTQTVSVSSEAVPQLQTESADTGINIQTQQVADLPLSTGRNFQNLLSMLPGAGYTVKDHSTFFNPQLSMSTTVNGQSSMYNTFNIEGVDDNQRSQLLQIYIPPAEAIQEVQVTASNYDPKEGAALGAVTNVILKSGGNQFHGAVYYFYQGDALAARQFFQTSPKTHAVYNYIGANVGGPIQKGKTFFFVNYLEYTQHLGEFESGISVPTPDVISGNFTNPVLTPIYDPTTGDTTDCLPGGNPSLCGTGRTQFSYNGQPNVIPPSRISPVAQALLSHVLPPNANQSTSGLQKYENNLLTSSLFTQDTPQIDVTMDRYFASNDHLSGRFSYEKPTLNQNGMFGVWGGPLSGGGIAGEEGHGTEATYSTGINWIHPFKSMLSETRIGISRFNNLAFPTGYGQNLSQQVGIPGANRDAFTSGVSTIANTGFSSPLIGGCNNCPWTRAGTLTTVVENMTKVAGNHTMDWGLNYIRWRDDLLLVGYPTGYFGFSAGTTALNAPGAPKSGFANQFASFLLGIPSSVQNGYANIFPAFRQNQTFLYFGDRWQMNPKTTVNLGMRWEYYGSPTPHQVGGFSNYNPTYNTLELAGIGQVPRNLGFQPDMENWGPRLGVAYRLTGNSVVRAGFGMTTLPWNIDLYAYNYPLEPSAQYSSLSSYGPAVLNNGTAASFAQGIPALPAYVPPANGIIPANGPLLNQSYYAINLAWKNPYLESWNVAYERTFGSWSLDVAYVGNRGVDSPIQYNENAATVYGQGALGQPEYGPCAACGSPNTNLGRTATTTEYFRPYSSNYNALQVKFDHKFSHGLMMTNSYAYSKAMGYISESGDYPNGLLDYVNQRRNYAETDFNQMHIFNETFLYRLPAGPGERWVNSGLPSQILGGWQLSGMWEATSGFPLSFSCSACARFNTPGSRAFPNMTGSFQRLHGIKTKPWFNTGPFSVPGAGTQGNVANYAFSGPRFFNINASIFKTFRINERMNFQFRSEWFNATNTPQFSNPNTSYGSSSFGLVTGTAGSARTINLDGKFTF